MRWLQHHWYRITPLHLILFPISLLFGALVALRRALYRSRILRGEKLPVPVVVVGNISVGGTGKTPLTLALAQQLINRGWHPLIISRGYGGAAQQPQRANAGSDTRQVGDEPLLMAQRNICPVWVGRDRAATARAALQTHPQCDVVLCDDGLQHYRLRRDVEIAVIDGARGLGNGWLLPAGPLREPASRLQAVDAVVVNMQARSPHPNLPPVMPSPQSSSETTGETTSHLTRLSKNDSQVIGYSHSTKHASVQVAGYPASGRGGKREEQSLIPANESLREFQFDGGNAPAGQYSMRLAGEIFHNLRDPEKTVSAAYFSALNNHAVAGIGHPQRYFQHLKTLGIPFTPHAFPDHHPYSAADLGFTGCDAILMTEKDAVKCAAFADEKYWVLRVDARIDSALTDHILRKIAPHGRQTA
ncbi:MAG: tetraacyldisaccharide 4'-kinase [Gallionella sp.]|nr:MAG: tetraacyldisaccharide 4'-kinase [Gallionella sp.]